MKSIHNSLIHLEIQCWIGCVMRGRKKHSHLGLGKTSRKILSMVQWNRMFPDDKVAEPGARLDSTTGRSGLPALRIRKRAVGGEVSEHELSLQILLGAHRHGHAELEPEGSELGDRDLTC